MTAVSLGIVHRDALDRQTLGRWMAGYAAEAA
jgi:hypothetical protein